MVYNNIGGDKMRKTSLYLDTSIINFAIDDRNPDEKKITQCLIDEIKEGKYEAFISELVTAEIDKAPQEIAVKLRDVMKGFEVEELAVDEEVENLANEYIKRGIIPVKYVNDAVHIVAASINNLDVVVSWNLEHMVKHKTRIEVMGINTFMGYRGLDICSPREVVENV